MSLLKSRLLERERSRQLSEVAESRRLQVGSGDRSQRIRTYNFPQGRITDHRINLRLYKLEEVLSGDLNMIIEDQSVEAQFRRVEMDTAPPQLLELPNDIQVDLARLEVHRDGQVVPLTPREGDILSYLIKHHDRVVTRDDLLLDVWHYQSANVETRTVDIHIVGLRRKVEPNPSEPTLIQTVRGKGYRWYS